jgi:hypothetical protein
VLKLPAQEVAIWHAAYAAEPWGDYRADLNSGVVAATIANVSRSKDTPAFSPADFMPFQSREELPQEGAAHDLETIKRLTGGT